MAGQKADMSGLLSAAESFKQAETAHAVRSHYLGVVEGLRKARTIATQQAFALWNDRKDAAAAALREHSDELGKQIRTLEQALEGDQLEHPSGV